MGRRAEIQPGWLVGLMSQWAKRQVPGHQLGYNSGSKWMMGLKASPASSIDPTGFAARDFSDLEAVLESLMQDGLNLWGALMMYYKPWVVPAFQEQGFPFANSTYYDRLHRAHTEVAASLNAMRAARMVLTEAAR